jgi:hypothetical protein
MSLQSTIDAATTGVGADRVGDRIDLPKGTIDLTETLDVATSVHGMRLVGRGRATRFRWRGDAAGPVFRFTNASGCELADVSVELEHPVDVLVQMKDDGEGPIRSSHDVLRNIHLPDAGENLGTFWHIGGGVDLKNDYMRGYDLDVAGCGLGVVVDGRNALNHELYGCVFKGRAAGRTGVRIDGGSLRMFGGALIQFTVSAIALDSPRGVAVTATGVHVEKCLRLITSTVPTGEIAAHIAVLDGVRWGSNSDEIPDDGEIVAFDGGTLIVRGCWFGTGTVNKTAYRFRYTTQQVHGDFVFEDNRIRAATKEGLFPGRSPTSVRGSLIQVGVGGEPEPVPA